MPVEPDDDPRDAFDVVHSKLLRGFANLVARLGGDAARIARRLGIAPEIVSEDRAVGYRQAIALVEGAAETLRCADFGMRLAMLQHEAGMPGPMGQAMRHSRSFGEALNYASVHSHAHSLAAGIWLKRPRSAKALFVGHDILLGRLPRKSQLIEQLLLLGHLGAMEMTGGWARARRVHFRHQPVSPPATYRRYFGCPVRFGCSQDGMLFSDADLACPILDRDAQAFRRAASHIDAEFPRRQPPLHAHARGVITHFLGTELCANDRVAAELNLHPRTMHRRLRAEGTSFQKIKDEVRRDVMLHYIQESRLPFSAISEKLGFAEQAVMSRACTLWFGASPTRLRARGRRANNEAEKEGT